MIMRRRADKPSTDVTLPYEKVGCVPHVRAGPTRYCCTFFVHFGWILVGGDPELLLFTVAGVAFVRVTICGYKGIN